MPDAWVSFLSTVAVAFVMSAGTWFLVSRQKRQLEADTGKSQAEARKTDADTAAVITGAAKDMILEMKDSIDRMGKQIDKLERQNGEKDTIIDAQEVRIEALEGEVRLVKARMGEYSKLNADLLQGSALLTEQIRSFGEEPIWRRGD